MAINIKRWLFPFAVSGDKVTVPETVSPTGAVSYPQGWGPDYERDPTTDPLAKRIPREESNQLMYDVTASLKEMQEQGLSWFIAAAQNGGVAFPYIKGARVLYDAAGVVSVYESLVDSNTALPTVTANWSRVDPARFATQAEATAGALGTVMVAPRELSRSVQRGAWNYAAATGTANALTVALDPAPAAWADLVGTPLRLKAVSSNTGAATLAVTGVTGTKPITRIDGSPLKANEILAGQIIEAVYDGTNVQISNFNPILIPSRSVQQYAAPGSFNWTVPAGIFAVFVEAWAAGGGGGGALGTGTAGGGGGGGGYASGWMPVTPGQVIPVVVGAAGAAGVVNGPGGNGGTTSVGTYCTLGGGQGGLGSFNAGIAQGGVGGTATGGTLNIIGGAGTPGWLTGTTTAAVGGPGGGTAFGAQGAVFAYTSGNNGLFPGGGASGGTNGYGGGVGANGFVRITY